MCDFLTRTFGSFSLRERQLNKVRVEVSTQHHSTGERLPLGAMFGAVEAEKDALGIQEYSIAQTSLEQIFNQFASQVRPMRKRPLSLDY